MPVANPNNPTAGSAEPYWFEWKTGLLYLVELLDEDSEVAAVAFQTHGTKGWDDVGVRFRDGRTQLLQMKHSRSGDPLTFGDLITAPSEGAPTLLRALARAWKIEAELRGNVECVLTTNRSAGTNWYQGRPPLVEFFDKVKIRVAQVTSLTDVHWEGEDERYPRAWEIFIAELSDLTPAEKFAFLQALNIKVDAPDLDALETRFRDRLAVLTGLPPSSVNGLFNALLANLRKWTCQTRREQEWIDREALRALLAGGEDAPPWLGHCEVETPEPFFPSRNAVVNSLQTSLQSESAHKVDFLSAEPGAGKTSCISKLARSGAVLWKEQCVSIRFYAYRPIRPGQSDTSSDFGIGVRPEALWLGLLWQIRDHLRKTHLLAELRVPVWLDGMSWEIAQKHVLRIADALGSRWGRCFVVCIDGIDHAARARRKNLPEFLQTLPSPDAIPAHVRFLLAGQPADAYPEYPFFLRQAHAAVKVHPIDTLADEDLRVLWRAAKSQLAAQTEDAVLRLLAEKAQRRTLPTVYAVEDIRTSATLEEAASTLDARPLADSLHNYYDAIWSAATTTSGDGPRLASMFVLLHERPTGELMASTFSGLGKSAAEWTDILRRLRPLVRETAEGFEMLHNDLRVHLDAGLANEPFARRDVASALANHYRKPTSNRFAAHLSLLDLLITAERRMDFANDFTVDWVIEAGALGLVNERLADECSAGFAAAVARQDWLLLHSVACASLTVHRLNECLANSDREHDPFKSKIAPTFLPAEGEPLPFELWGAADFSELLAACQRLIDCGAEQRAALVLKQWVGGISVEALVERLATSAKSGNERNGGREVLRRDFERLGRLCALCRLPLVSKESDLEKNAGHRAAIETGWVRGLAELPSRQEALRYWCRNQPRYVASWVAAVEAAAGRGRWGEVRALLNRMERCVEKLNPADRLTFGWYAARSRPKNVSIWQEPFMRANYSLAEGNTPLTTLRLVAQWITYTSPTREPTQVVDDLLPLLDTRRLESNNTSAIAPLLCASAIIGRLLRYRDRNDPVGAETAVPKATLAPLLEALWCCEPDWRNLPHDEVHTPGEVGGVLAQIAWESGSPYRQLLCDIAKARFANIMLWDEGTELFDMLWECSERAFLTDAVGVKAREVIERLHEHDPTSRNRSIANLLHFTRRLEMRELEAQLANRLRRTRIGYVSSKEWVFQPLVRWFEFVRKSSPAAWRMDGAQLLALDKICEQQGGDNGFSDEVIAEVGAAAMECGPNDFEALFQFLVARGTKHPLWDLANAAQNGFTICLSEQHTMSEESTLARIAIAIALGRWPRESALKTVSTLLTTHEVPRDLAQQPAWEKAIRLAAEIQGAPAKVEPGESSGERQSEPVESRSAEAILSEIIQPKDSSWIRLRDIASLAEQARTENHSKRDELVAAALGELESAEMLSRCIEFHDIRLMSRLYGSLTESERWRLLGAITAVTGDMRKEGTDPNWAFMVAFSGVDLACRTRATGAGQNFAVAVFHQLLETHWKWHGIPAPASPVMVGNTPSTWPDAARRMLLSLMQTDACETLYMAMSGVRFFAEVFPDQIPIICQAGLADETARDAILALGQLWATRHPHSLTPTLGDFAAYETSGLLEERLDTWAVGALHNLAIGIRLRRFPLPPQNGALDIAFPGDGPLFEGEAQTNGLWRHNAFAKMANTRLRRAGIVLGPMDSAYRHMARAVKEGKVEFPPMILPAPKKLALDSSSPRQRHDAERIIGDAILHQSAGKVWSPAEAAAVRLLMGYGVDPWIASALPNAWPTKESWPDDVDVERWLEAGASKTADMGRRLTDLLEGHDLDPALLLLGAVLRIPTYRRDLQFHFWLAAPNGDNEISKQGKSTSPSGRTLAGWLAGWSFAASQPADATSIHFTGSLVNYPNSDLDITPSGAWTEHWGWKLDFKNNLRFLNKSGSIVAWHERWLGPDASHRSLRRQPMLNRWVARRDGFPVEAGELHVWNRRTDMESGLLSQPE
jgi:hypothetical protein